MDIAGKNHRLFCSQKRHCKYKVINSYKSWKYRSHPSVLMGEKYNILQYLGVVMSVVQLTGHMGVCGCVKHLDRWIYTHTYTEHLACSVRQSWQIQNARHSCCTKAVYLWVPATQTVNQFEAIELRGSKSFGGCFSSLEKGPLSTSRNVVVEMEVGMLMLMENIPQTQYLRCLPSELLTWAFRCRLPKMEAGSLQSL